MADDRSGISDGVLMYLPDLIAGIDPAVLLEFIKSSHSLTDGILRGYRTTTRALASPVVQQRLISFAEHDPSFLKILESMWIDNNKNVWSRTALSKIKDIKESLDDLVKEFGPHTIRIALLLDDRRTVNRLADKVGMITTSAEELQEATTATEKSEQIGSEAPAGAVERLKYERKQLKARIRKLESEVKKLESTLEIRQREVEQSKAEIASLQSQLSEQARQIKRAEKSIERLLRGKASAERSKVEAERELKKLRKQLEESPEVKHEPAVVSSSTVRHPQSPDWFPVISTMLKNHAYQAARVFCETLTQSDPNSLHAHLALEHVYARTGVRDKQLTECLWIANHLSERGQATRACAYACRALEVSPESTEARKMFREILGRIGTTDESAVTAVRGLLSRLRTSSKSAYTAAREVLEKLGKQYLRTYDIHPEVLHVDKIIDLTDGSRSLQMSIRRIMEAVDANDVEIVKFVRQALANLKISNPVLYRNILQSLLAYDRSCVTAVLRDTQPVVVDGSNVAWHDIKEKPRLQNILDLRSELRSEGYFPVYIYVDAALPYQVDKASALQQLIESGAVVAVESHTDADQAMMEQARRLACPIVTNDRMTDWDPEGEIPKLRFSIDRFGVTIYNR